MAQALLIITALWGIAWMAYIVFKLEQNKDKPCVNCWFYYECDFKGECPRWQERKGNTGE